MAINEEVTYLVYLNRFNEVKGYKVEIHHSESGYIDVWDLIENKHKTFYASNVLQEVGSLEEADRQATIIQQSYRIKPRPNIGSREKFVNRKGQLEVCFTGFKKEEKQRLELLAQENGLFIRTSVTKKLGLLVMGDNAGPSKMKQAIKNKVARVDGEEGFLLFLQGGEIYD